MLPGGIAPVTPGRAGGALGSLSSGTPTHSPWGRCRGWQGHPDCFYFLLCCRQAGQQRDPCEELLTPHSGEQGWQQGTGVPEQSPFPVWFLGTPGPDTGGRWRYPEGGGHWWGAAVGGSMLILWNGWGWQVLGEAVGTGMRVATCLSGVRSVWWQCQGLCPAGCPCSANGHTGLSHPRQGLWWVMLGCTRPWPCLQWHISSLA